MSLLLAAHLAGTLYHLPPSEIFGNPPIARTDYTTHFYEAATVARFLRETGQSWGYDPHFMAGYPLGTVFDLNNKGLEIATWLLSFFVDVKLAFNLTVLVLFALLPLAIVAAARLAGLTPWAQALAVFLALVSWYTDAALHWAWSGGTFAFAISSGLAVCVLAAFVRYLAMPTWCAWAVLAGTTPLTILVAPQIAMALAPPMLVGYLLSWRRVSRSQYLGFVAVAGLVLAINAFWFEPFLRFLYIKTRSDTFLQGGLETLARDLLGNRLFPGGSPCRCGVRWLDLGLTGWLWLRWRQHDRYVPVFGAGILSLFGLAYLGSYWHVLADFQPHRFVIPASLLATLPAADAVTCLARTRPRLCWTSAAVGLMAVFLIARTAEGAWEFRPHLAAIRQPVRPNDGRLGGPPPSYTAVLTWIAANTTPAGRLMVNDWRLGALIPYVLDREVIGGPFHPAWIQHGHANAGIWDAFGRDLDAYTEAELGQVLQTYNVQWVITFAAFDASFNTLDDVARRWPGLLRFADEVAGFRMYRVPWPANGFLVGSGRVSSAYNQLAVHDASPGRVVLKYHWLPTLRSDPPLPIQSYAMPDAPVGFIQVDNGATRDFVIYNQTISARRVARND